MPSIQSIRGSLVRHLRLASLVTGLAVLAYILNLLPVLLAANHAVTPYLHNHARSILLTTLAIALILAAIPYKRFASKLPKPKLTSNSTFLVVFIPLIALSVAIIFLLPSWYVSQTIPGETPEHRLTHEETERKDTGALLLSLFGAYGLYLTWRRAEAGDRTVKTMEQGHITDRYTKAIDHLGKVDGGKANVEVRLGAIYALERIAWDSPRDHWTIMEVLTAYIRQNAPATTNPVEDVPAPKPSTEIQAILDVLQRRNHSIERKDQRLNLTATDLRRANLREAQLQRADLMEAQLQDADLSGAQLQDAFLNRAKLQRANLMEAQLQGADLIEAQLQHARLSGAQLQSAFLYGAQLQGAIEITVPQIKNAIAWEHAYYDPHFRGELGLADETPPPVTDPE